MIVFLCNGVSFIAKHSIKIICSQVVLISVSFSSQYYISLIYDLAAANYMLVNMHTSSTWPRVLFSCVIYRSMQLYSRQLCSVRVPPVVIQRIQSAFLSSSERLGLGCPGGLCGTVCSSLSIEVLKYKSSEPFHVQEQHIQFKRITISSSS